ncbi:hypothetical protein Pmani_035951 [Petrolisthes manimaculis]|uniref:Uncharacterized protein n=1 Tax=Petrolisthes manimaculis TaxID=1843537 RepID=A0AAE1NL67_9EUCA|nr:hypothetical protein Pmani_035951 [Petrolisthes manimaculis]
MVVVGGGKGCGTEEECERKIGSRGGRGMSWEEERVGLNVAGRFEARGWMRVGWTDEGWKRERQQKGKEERGKRKGRRDGIMRKVEDEKEGRKKERGRGEEMG